MNLVLVGLGYWGKNFKRILENSSFSFSLKYIVDPNLKNIEGEYLLFESIDQLLNEASDIDCAIVSTPTSTHYDIAKKLIENKIHTLIEKPLTTEFETAKELIDLAQDQKTVLMTDYIYLYNESIKKIISYIQNEDIGKLIHISFERSNLGPIRTDVNALWDLTTHDVSILQAMTNLEPKEISSSGYRRKNSEVEDMVNISIKYDDLFVTIFSSWLHPEKSRKIKIVGDKKMIIFDDLSQEEPIKIYDKKISDINEKESIKNSSVFSFSVGDVTIPYIDRNEPLSQVVIDFNNRINGNEGDFLNSDDLSLRTIKLLNDIEEKL